MKTENNTIICKYQFNSQKQIDKFLDLLKKDDYAYLSASQETIWDNYEFPQFLVIETETFLQYKAIHRLYNIRGEVLDDVISLEKMQNFYKEFQK